MSALAILITVAIAVVFSFLFTFPLMWAINYVFSASLLTFLFGTSTIGFWKTFLLSLICSTLFKSISTSK